MSRRIAVLLEADDKATGKVRLFGDELERAAVKGGAGASAALARTSTSIGASIDQMASRAVMFGKIIGGIGAGLALRSGLTFGAEFQKQMSAVQAVTGVTQDQLRSLSMSARELGPQFGFSGTVAAKAMENLGLAGFSANEIVSLLPNTLVLAKAGALDLADAATIASDVLRGMGIETELFGHVADVLALTASSTNAEVSDLGESFKFVGSIARAFGVPLEEVAGALGVLANRGIRAEMAGTGLRRILSVLNGDLEDGEKGLSGYGITLTDVDGKFVGLTEAIRRMSAAGVSNQDILEAFGQRGGPVLISLMQAGAGAVSELEGQLRKADGTARKMADIRMDNLAGDWSKLVAGAQSIAVTLFDKTSPALRESVQLATRFASTFEQWARAGSFAQGLARAVIDTGGAIALLIAYKVGSTLASWVTWILSTNAALRAQQVQVVQTAAGITAYDVATKQATTSTAAYNTMLGVNIGTLSRFQAAGLLAGAAITGWQVGRLIGELTGLDQVMERFWDKTINGARDQAAASRSLQQSIALIEAFTQKTGDTSGVEHQIVKVRELQEEIKRLSATHLSSQGGLVQDNTVAIARLRGEIEQYASAIVSAADSAADLHRVGTTLARQQPALWAESGREALTYAERVQYVELRIGQQAAAQARAAAASEAAAARRKAITEEEAKALVKATAEMEQRLLGVGVATKSMVAQFDAHFARIRAIAEQQGVPFSDLVKSMRDDIIRLVDAAHRAGVEVPLALSAAFGEAQRQELRETQAGYLAFLSDAGATATDVARITAEGWTENDNVLENLNEKMRILAEERVPSLGVAMATEFGRLSEFQQRWNQDWIALTNNLISGFSQTAASAIVTGESLSKSIKALWKQTATSVIAFLIEMGIRRLILGKISAMTGLKEHGANVTAGLAETYVNSFASAAAIPFVGWAMAPGVAAANLATATGVATPIMASAAGAAAFAEGGIINRPTRALMGEVGPEAVVPLTGRHARRVAKEMGLDGSFGGGGTVQVTIHLGDNWSDTGRVPQGLVDQIVSAVSEGIRRGRLQPLPVGAS